MLNVYEPEFKDIDNRIGHTQTFLYDYNLHNMKKQDRIILYLQKMREFIMNFNEPYPEYINKSVRTIDIYGLGIAFLSLYEYTGDYMKEKYPLFSSKILGFIDKMVEPNPLNRADIDTLCNEYKDMLVEIEVKTQSKTINNNVDLNADVVYQPSFLPLEKPKKRCPKGTRRNKKTGECEEPKEVEVLERKKRCPNGTRRNKKTGLCE
jgi:hypothetical protein